MSNNDTYQDIKQRKQQAEIALDEAKATQLIEANQNQEIAQYTQERDLANQLHGKLVVFSGVNDLFRAAYLTKLREIRDSKLYRHVSIIDDTGKSTQCGTFKDYCKFALRRSYSSVHEQLKDNELFGGYQDTLKDMGVQRDQFRLLHHQDDSLIEEVKQAASNNDKDKVLEIIDDLSSKHSKEKEKLIQEKETLQKQLEEAQARKEADDRLLESKEQKINEQYKVINKCLTPDEERQYQLEQERELMDELELIKAECTNNIDRLNLAIGKIYNHPKCSEELEEMPLKFYEYLLKHLANVSYEHGMIIDTNQIFPPVPSMFSGQGVEEDNG